MKSKKSKSIVVIVAHPDDETLWAGGTILSHPLNKWFIVCLCRASDKDRSEKFYNTLKLLKSEGIMGDLDDGPDQKPLDRNELEEQILKLLPATHFDLVITHGAKGEYTRHLRHEEVNKAVTTLWFKGKISADKLWTFAFEDGEKAYFPRAIEKANLYETLPEQIWLKKYSIITETYGFQSDSWEAKTTPRAEAFWEFKDPHFAKKTLLKKEDELNIFSTPDLEVLKSKYQKSVSDKRNLEKEMLVIAEAFSEFKKSGNAKKKSIYHFEKGLRVLKKQSMNILKSRTSKNIGFLFNRENWDLKTFSISLALWELDNKIHKTRRSLTQFGNELRIFHHPSIENLKTLYNKTEKLLEDSQEQNVLPNSI